MASWCNTGEAGNAGVVRLHSSGKIEQHLGGLEVLLWDELHNQSDAESLVDILAENIYRRDVDRDERNVVCALVALAGSGDIQFCRSEFNDTPTDPRRNRIAMQIKGRGEQQSPVGYTLSQTEIGKEFIRDLSNQLDTSNAKLGCSDAPGCYGLVWTPRPTDLYAEQNDMSSSSPDSVLMNLHCDKKASDIAVDGTPARFNSRSLIYFGRSFILVTRLKLVWAVPTGKLLKNGRPEFEEKTKTIVTHEMPMPGPFGVYCMSNRGAGHEPGYAMVDPEDGILKAVVIFHGTKYGKGPSSCSSRGFFCFDRIFDTREAESRHFNNCRRGNPEPFEFRALERFCSHDNFQRRFSRVNNANAAHENEICRIIELCSIWKAEYDAKYYQQHKAKKAEYGAKYRQEHKANIAEYGAKYRQEHKAKIAEYGAKYRQEHKAEKAEYDAKYRQEHKAEKAENSAIYYQKHKANIAENGAKYYQQHKAKIAENGAKYRQEHKAEKAEYDAKYRQEHKAEKAENSAIYYQKHKAEKAEYYQEHKAEIATIFVDSLMKPCIEKCIVTELRSYISCGKIRIFIKKHKLGLSFNNAAWSAIKEVLEKSLVDLDDTTVIEAAVEDVN